MRKKNFKKALSALCAIGISLLTFASDIYAAEINSSNAAKVSFRGDCVDEVPQTAEEQYQEMLKDPNISDEECQEFWNKMFANTNTRRANITMTVLGVPYTESYRKKSKYWVDVVRWDESKGTTGIDRPIMPLLETDAVLYTMEELERLPHVIIYLAKNEIYARYGYIFSDPDLQNYFMGQIWYTPKSERGEFDDSVFNEYEKENLSLMLEILE